VNDSLLLILSIIGFFALYWVLIGQWRWNKQAREMGMREAAKEAKEKARKK